ncbi:hypothetical protein Erwinia_phage_Pastis_00003 [Erwinia phage Pastis]|nr:hypothetical protein Erwinia_phage_Pastis_00003 [Erwinia phage Pastis]
MSQSVNKLKRAIKRHVQAQVDLSWVGGLHPDDRPAVEREAVTAKRKLDEAIRNIQMQLSDPERQA